MKFIVYICVLAAAVFYGIIVRIKLARLRKKHALLQHSGAETANFLDTFTGNITKMGDAAEWMNETVRYAGEFAEAQAACVFRVEGDFLTVMGVHGPFPSLSEQVASNYVLSLPKYAFENLRKEKIRLGQGPAGIAALEKRIVFIPNLALDPDFSGLARSAGSIRSLIALPLVSGNHVTGVLCLVNNKNNPDSPFTLHQQEQARSLAKRISLVLDIMNVYSSMREQERISQELAFTRRLQLALMPEEPKMEWGDFQMCAFAVSSKEVSGDYYDFVKLDQNRLLVVVGDASGKGLPACLIMAMTRTYISSCAGRFENLKQLLSGLNEYLRQNTIGEKYITLGCCLLDRKNATIEYACGGHTPMIMHLHQHLREIRPDGPVCGIFSDAEYESLCTSIAPGTTLLLYSDGINEALNRENEEFGIERLRNVYREACESEMDPEEIVTHIKKTVDEYSGHPDSLSDDQTLIAIRYGA